MLKTGTVLKHATGSPEPQVLSGEKATPRSSPLSKRVKENFPVVLVDTNEGPCWAKNQSEVVASGVPSAFIRAKSATFSPVSFARTIPNFHKISPAPAPLL